MAVTTTTDGVTTTTTVNNKQPDDAWFGIYWKPAVAIVYLIICLFDFVLVPTYMGIFSDHLNTIILAIKDLPADAQVVVLNLKLAPWEPLTLKGGGLFHVAFGAILGASVWSRGQERINEIKAGWGPSGGVNSGTAQDPNAPQ